MKKAITTKVKGLTPLKAACLLLDTNTDEIRSPTKKRNVARARVFISWAYSALGFSPEEIGLLLNRRPSTVKKYSKMLSDRVKHDKFLRLSFTNFKKKLKYF